MNVLLKRRSKAQTGQDFLPDFRSDFLSDFQELNNKNLAELHVSRFPCLDLMHHIANTQHIYRLFTFIFSYHPHLLH